MMFPTKRGKLSSSASAFAVQHPGSDPVPGKFKPVFSAFKAFQPTFFDFLGLRDTLTHVINTTEMVNTYGLAPTAVFASSALLSIASSLAQQNGLHSDFPDLCEPFPVFPGFHKVVQSYTFSSGFFSTDTPLAEPELVIKRLVHTSQMMFTAADLAVIDLLLQNDGSSTTAALFSNLASALGSSAGFCVTPEMVFGFLNNVPGFEYVSELFSRTPLTLRELFSRVDKGNSVLPLSQALRLCGRTHYQMVFPERPMSVRFQTSFYRHNSSKFKTMLPLPANGLLLVSLPDRKLGGMAFGPPRPDLYPVSWIRFTGQMFDHRSFAGYVDLPVSDRFLALGPPPPYAVDDGSPSLYSESRVTVDPDATLIPQDPNLEPGWFTLTIEQVGLEPPPDGIEETFSS